MEKKNTVGIKTCKKGKNINFYCKYTPDPWGAYFTPHPPNSLVFILEA